MIKRIWNWIDLQPNDNPQFINRTKWRLYDKFNPSPPRPLGCELFIGAQGMGKTSGVVHYLKALPELFPEKVHIGSVTYTKYSDFQINTKQDIIDAPGNSVLFIDEAGILFPSESGKRDLEMLAPLCQSRKKAKQLIFTAQRSGLVIKTIRDLTTEVRMCYTRDGRHMKHFIFSDVDLFFHLSEAYLSFDEKIQKADQVLEYVLTNDLRRSYDTYETVGGSFDRGLKVPRWGPTLAEYTNSLFSSLPALAGLPSGNPDG